MNLCLSCAILLIGAAVTLRHAAAADPLPDAWPNPDWQTATPEREGFSPAGVERVGQWLKEHGSKTGLMVRHGRIVGEWYFDGAQPSSQFLVYSTSKSLASTAAGLAIHEGKLNLDTKVGEFLPDVSPAEKRDITVRQLLSMTSGVHNDPKLGDMTDRFSYALYKAPMDFKPGEKWDYNNTGLAILSPLLLKVTGTELDVWLKQKLFDQIGIQDSNWSWDHNEGHPLSYSGLHITAHDLARFGLLVLNDGKWHNKQVVPAAWVEKATQSSQELNSNYGYLWWVNRAGKWPGVPADAYAALGRFDNSMLIVPSLDLIVLRQVGDDSAHEHKMDIGELWKLAVDAVVQKNSDK